jgi:hypothetical protein
LGEYPRFRDPFDIAHEVENEIAYGRCHERGESDPQAFVALEAAHKGGVEEKFNQQLLKVKIKPVPQFGERLRMERFIGVPEQLETGHARAGDHRISPDRYIGTASKKKITSVAQHLSVG